MKKENKSKLKKIGAIILLLIMFLSIIGAIVAGLTSNYNISQPTTAIQVSSPILENTTNIDSIDTIIEDNHKDIEIKEETYTTMYSTVGLNIREQPSLSSNIIKTVIINTKLQTVDNSEEDGWIKIKIDNNYYYVYSKYLSKQKTVIQTTSRSMNQVRKIKSDNGDFVGYFTLTYYCSCSKCCGKTNGITAWGTKATAGKTIATSSKFAFGTKLIINGHEYIVEDRGGAIQGNKIDIFVNSHSEALQLGVKKNVPVYMGQ